MPDSLVGVNTMIPNRLLYKSIQAGLIKELTGFDYYYFRGYNQ